MGAARLGVALAVGAVQVVHKVAVAAGRALRRCAGAQRKADSSVKAAFTWSPCSLVVVASFSVALGRRPLAKNAWRIHWTQHRKRELANRPPRLDLPDAETALLPCLSAFTPPHG